jgi:hypothetical protein
MKINNKWKVAFWLLFVIWIATSTFLVYQILDQGVTLTYLREGYEDTEHDLEQLSDVIEGKLTKQDFKEIIKRYPDGIENELGLNRINIVFDTAGKVKKVTSQW